MSESINSLGQTLTALIGELAGKGSDIKLSFHDLTLEVGMIKAKLNGAVTLDIKYVTENT